MPRMNSDKLVEISVIGEVSSPGFQMHSPWRIGHDGVPRVGVTSGGITYNVRVGNPACGWEGDHVEPCVSVRNPDERQSGGLNVLATLGNEARLVTRRCERRRRHRHGQAWRHRACDGGLPGRLCWTR